MPSSRRLLPLVAFAVVHLGCCRTPSSSSSSSSSSPRLKIYEKETVTLPCYVDDSGLQTRVQWWKNEVLLADSDQPELAKTNPRINMWGNQSLELVQVRPEDSGEYVCRASRPEPWGSVTQVHAIQVMYPASAKPVPESGLIEVDLGEEVELKCETEGVPKPSLSWSFRGQEMPTLASEHKSLRIRVDNQSLAGVYTCVATNGIDEPARANIELKIKHKPEVRAAQKTVYTGPGMRAQLDCQVVAWPEARLEWWFEGAKLERSHRFLNSNQDLASDSVQLYTLVIRSVQEGNLGWYTCVAQNEMGKSEAVIEVSGVPRPPHLKRGSSAASGGSYLFIWEVESYTPIVQYNLCFKQVDTGEDWRRLTVPSASEPDGPLHAHSYNLTGLDSSKQYEAMVFAQNRFGWSSPSKVVRFSPTDDLDFSSWGEENAGFKQIVSVGHEEIPPAVQVTSSSDRSSVASSSGSSFLYAGGTNELLVMAAALILVVAVALLLPLLFRRLSVNHHQPAAAVSALRNSSSLPASIVAM